MTAASLLPHRCLGKHSFVAGSDAQVTFNSDEPVLLQFQREQHRDAEPEALSANTRPSQPCDCASVKLAVSAVGAAHAEFVAVLAGHPPRPIPLEADAIDLEDRADHLGKVFAALSVYVTLILDDTAQNVPGRLDLRDAEGVLADLASDLTGAIQKTADDMAGRPA
jgi:hypothetical protein